MIFVDTNYFLRFLLKDNKEQFDGVKSLFEKGSRGEITLFTSIIVFFEIYWVLSSFYGKDKSEIIRILAQLLSLAFIRYENATLLENAVIIYRESQLDLEDSYNIAFYRENSGKEFRTFDGKLERYLRN